MEMEKNKRFSFKKVFLYLMGANIIMLCARYMTFEQIAGVFWALVFYKAYRIYLHERLVRITKVAFRMLKTNEAHTPK